LNLLLLRLGKERKERLRLRRTADERGKKRERTGGEKLRRCFGHGTLDDLEVPVRREKP
jgi:hypothetical protein